MKTKKLYKEDMYLKEWVAKVVQVITDPEEIQALGGGLEASETALVVLDQSAFFPEGGGQPSDKGRIGPASIFYVFEKDGVVYHQALLSQEEACALVGTEATCFMDWEIRFRHMQRHLGEHILSAAFYELYGGVNRGFHMGDAYMTVDISLEENPDYTAFTDEMMEAAEWESNRYIWEDAPVTFLHFDSREEAEKLPMRKKLALEEDITLVCVGDENKAAGRVACCGTHPSTAGQVGLIKIYRWESYKGMTRIYFDAGQDALKHFMKMDQAVKAIARRYSTDAFGLADKLAAQDKKNQALRQEHYELKNAYIRERLTQLVSDCRSQALEKEKEGKEKLPVMVREYPLLKTDDLLAIGKEVPKEIKNLIALISPLENTVFLICQGGVDCGKVVKDNAPVWKGKGGGNGDNARAMFPSRQELDCFVDFLQKAF